MAATLAHALRGGGKRAMSVALTVRWEQAASLSPSSLESDTGRRGGTKRNCGLSARLLVGRSGGETHEDHLPRSSL